MKIMAIDSGDVRTGLAVCDPLELLASPLCVIKQSDQKALIQEIKRKAIEHEIEMLVIGNPKNMNGSDGERAKKAKKMAAELKEETKLEVELWDERNTTVLAEKYLSVSGRFGKKRKAVIDAVAAVLILENYMAFRKNSKERAKKWTMHDSHVHSDVSRDGVDCVNKLLEAAEAAKIASFTTTDHCEFVAGHLAGDLLDVVRKSQKAALRAKEEAKYKTRIRLGIELGQPHRDPVLAQQILSEFEFDLVLGSVHRVPDFGEIFNLLQEDDSNIVRQVLKQYFDELLELISWNKFDVLAHLWYPVRYINSEELFDEFTDEISEVLKLLAENGKALELNTSTKGKDLSRLILDCLHVYAKHGGKLVTLGSDAHRAEVVGRGFEQARELLISCGFNSYVNYEGRKPLEVKF